MFLLVGGDSEIAAATHRFLTARGRPVAATTRRPDRVAADRPFLDLTASLDYWEPPTGTRAACVYAGIARLADCAANPTGSAHVNVKQTLALIERLLVRDIPVLFLSTNQVFDGAVPNVPPDAAACPTSEYGIQKAQTEAVLREHIARGAPVAILRLAKVVSPGMPLLHGWIDALVAGKPIRAFHDMTLAPTPTEMVCTAIGALMANRAGGIYQLTGPRDVAYTEVGRFVACRLGADPALVAETSALEAGLPEGATRRHTTLDSSLLAERYGLVVPDIWEVIGQIMTTRRDGVDRRLA